MNAAILNLTLFKTGWLAVVFAAAASLPGIGTAVIGLIVAIHLARSENPQHELRLLILAASIGFIWESLLVGAGVVQYTTHSLLAGTAPYWIVAMWVLFATTLNVGMRWLRKSTIVATLFGAIGGPMAFLAGEKIGAVSFPEPATALLLIGIGWAVFLPLLVRYAARNDERAAAPA